MRHMRRFFSVRPSLAAVVLAVLICGAPQELRAAIAECIDATCRLTAGHSRGTGCVFEVSGGRVFVLTNAHVVGGAATVRCEFWRHGHCSLPLTGRVIARRETAHCDAAIVALEVSQFAGWVPRAIPLAPPTAILRPGEPITSVGCARGAWSTSWKGHVLGYRNGDLHFVPPPENGRSGSAIFDAAGTQIVGLLRARTGDDAAGVACTVQALYANLSQPAAYQDVQCSPDGSCCPGGSNLFPLLGNRRRLPEDQQPYFPGERLQPPGSADPWPGLGSPRLEGVEEDRLSKQIGQVGEDLRGLTTKVDELLAEIRKRSEALSPQPPAERVDSTAREAQLARAKAEANSQAIDEMRQDHKQTEGLLDELVRDHMSLHERIAARREKVSGQLREELGRDPTRGEVAGAYVRDFAQERLSCGAGWTLGKVLAGSLGLSGPLAAGLAVAGFFAAKRIRRKIDEGEPLLIQQIHDRLSEKLDHLRDRLAEITAPAQTTRKRVR